MLKQEKDIIDQCISICKKIHINTYAYNSLDLQLAFLLILDDLSGSVFSAKKDIKLNYFLHCNFDNDLHYYFLTGSRKMNFPNPNLPFYQHDIELRHIFWTFALDFETGKP